MFFFAEVERIWKEARERLASDDTLDSSKKRSNIAKIANVARLAPFADLSLINKFAEKFGLDPDQVYLKEFDTVMNMHWLWREQEEFQERYIMIEEMMSKTNK